MDLSLLLANHPPKVQCFVQLTQKSTPCMQILQKRCFTIAFTNVRKRNIYKYSLHLILIRNKTAHFNSAFWKYIFQQKRVKYN